MKGRQWLLGVGHALGKTMAAEAAGGGGGGGFCELTRGHPGADGNALLVSQDGEDADKVLHAWLQLPDSGGCLVPGHAELHFQAVLVGGRVHDQVLRDPHLVVPGQVYSLFGHFCHDEVFRRGHWQEGKEIAGSGSVSKVLYKFSF